MCQCPLFYYAHSSLLLLSKLPESRMYFFSRSEIISRLGLSVALRTASESWPGSMKTLYSGTNLIFFGSSHEKR